MARGFYERINLNWQDNSDNEDGFHIERNGSEIAQLPTDTILFRDEDLPDGSTFCYRVRASNEAGFSDYSNEACGTIVWPTLTNIEPVEAAPGQCCVQVTSQSGYLRIGGLYDESARPFDLFFDGAGVGAINCYVTLCDGTFTVPSEVSPGDHQVCTQGGSCLTLRVVQAVATPTPTPSPAREWNLEDIEVDGSTVTVVLRVFAGIDVRVTLDGRNPDQVNTPVPIIEFVFQNVTPGKHTIGIRDVVGFEKTAEVVVPTAGIPEWLTSLIKRLDNEPVVNPPASVTQYEYKGQTVYFVPQRCCDIFSDLYDADGNITGHPDGGIAGQGDGRVPDFFEERKNERVIRKDQRTYDPRLVQVPAPIESVEISIMESIPPQYMVVVVFGLPNGCATFGGYRVERGDDTIRIEMVNRKLADPEIACPAIYDTVETKISLGSDFEPGETYTVVVNDMTETFGAQYRWSIGRLAVDKRWTNILCHNS